MATHYLGVLLAGRDCRRKLGAVERIVTAPLPAPVAEGK